VAESGQGWAKGGWRSPAGLGTIAAVAGVLVAVAALVVDWSGRSQPASAPSPSGGGTYVFVYGTTMPGHLRYPLIEGFVASQSPDRASGRLYDTGVGYPAAKFGGQGTIEGYLLRLRPDRVSEALRTFTEIEAGQYERVQITTGSGITAFAYEYIGSTEGMAELAGRWSGPES
jgi:gamma-glutamylcyclotransferase (GGCT)/AIG2-like uncharacterized protein YtfP